LPCPPPGDFSNPGIKPRSPTLQADCLLIKPLGKPILRKGINNREERNGFNEKYQLYSSDWVNNYRLKTTLPYFK